MDANQFPPIARGRRERWGNNHFANHDRNRIEGDWRNHNDFKDKQEHKEEPAPRLPRIEQRMRQNPPEQVQNPLPTNALNDMGALQRMVREMMDPEARR